MDIALDREAWGTSFALAFLRLFCLRPQEGTCSVPGCEAGVDEVIFDHFLCVHAEIDSTASD